MVKEIVQEYHFAVRLTASTITMVLLISKLWHIVNILVID